MDTIQKEKVGKRKGHPKSRWGCRTCKIRKVKCDETKPLCKRCQKEGHTCDGYPEPPPRKNASKRQAPQNASSALLTHRSRIQPLTYQPTTRLFENENEHSYHRLFCDRVVGSARFDPSFWDSLVLQACERDVSIRHAVIALGALQLTETTSQFDVQKAKTHHYSALQHYNRALKLMRRTAISGKQDVNIALIACILIACFEQGQGHHSSALRQITIGLDLIEGYLARLASTKAQLPAIEEKLFYAFERLDLQSVCFIDPYLWKRHKVMQKLAPIDIDAIPCQSPNLLEAKRYYNLISRRLMELVSESRNGEKHEQEISQCLSKLQSWHESFLPLFDAARVHKSHSDYLLATLLELNYVLINLTTSLDRTSSLQHTKSAMPALRLLVSLIEDTLLHPSMSQNTGAFTLEIQVTAPLNFAAWVCPERSLRRKAISLMTNYPRKEALWDSRVVGKVAECVMLQEEMNIDGEVGDYFPDDMKCIGADIFDFDVVRRQMRMRCLLPKKTGEERSFEWVPKEGALVTW